MSDRAILQFRLRRSRHQLDVDLDLPNGGVTVFFGTSGAGKTSLLRCVAGLERPEGRIHIGPHVWQDDRAGVFVPTWQRRVGYVFQEPSLFDHLDVAGNLAFGLKIAGRQGNAQSLRDAIALLGLEPLLGRACADLSGGEKQRVAIARALATRPQLLLLDEPLASLDVARKQDILPWLERLHRTLALPVFYVTHAPDEVARLADRVVVIESGRTGPARPPEALFSDASSPLATGDDAGALLQGMVSARDEPYRLVRIDVGPGLALWMPEAGLAAGAQVRLRVYARDVSLTMDAPANTSIQNHWPATILRIDDKPDAAHAMVWLECGNAPTQTLLARITRRAVHTLALAPGSRVWAQVKSVALAR